MTPEEAVKYIKNYRGVLPSDSEEPIDLAIKALEKQIPQKPEKINRDYFCPSCGEMLYWANSDKPNCMHCGGALDWSESEEE